MAKPGEKKKEQNPNVKKNFTSGNKNNKENKAPNPVKEEKKFTDGKHGLKKAIPQPERRWVRKDNVSKMLAKGYKLADEKHISERDKKFQARNGDLVLVELVAATGADNA